MKILITTDWYKPVVNGVVISILNLQKELTELGHEVRVFTLSDTYHNYYNAGVYYVGSVSLAKIYPNARLKVATYRKMFESILDWKPDIIHSQCEFSSFFMARKIARRLNIPIVHTYHTVYEDYTHYFSPNKKWGKSLVAALSRNTLQKTVRVIVPTGKVQKILESYYIDIPINIVPSGIDLSLFNGKLPEETRAEIKRKLDIPAENKIVVYVGRLAKEKNLNEIISFMAKINNPKVTLLIVGDGPYREKIEEIAKNSGYISNIIFTGMVAPAEVATYYKMGDVFVSASQSETQGLTYVECLACGVPAICKQDECLEGVIVNGENGWQYTTFYDFEKYISRILRDDDLRDTMSANAIKTANEYSTPIFAGRVEAVYNQALREYLAEYTA